MSRPRFKGQREDCWLVFKQLDNCQRLELRRFTIQTEAEKYAAFLGVHSPGNSYRVVFDVMPTDTKKAEA
jgi:hypothetical protein